MFPKWMFWDVDISNLDPENDANFVIDRVLNWYIDDVSFLEILEQIYTLDKIKYYAIKMDVRGNERIEFLCKRYNLNTSDFRYYLVY